MQGEMSQGRNVAQGEMSLREKCRREKSRREKCRREKCLSGRNVVQSIKQALKQDGEYHLVASVDGSEIFDHVIKNPEDFSDVKLYLSDPWQESFGDYGELENFTWNAL